MTINRPEGIARRHDMSRWTTAEHKLREAALAVEALGADPLLTQAVDALSKARNRVADFVDKASVIGLDITGPLPDDVLEAIGRAGPGNLYPLSKDELESVIANSEESLPGSMTTPFPPAAHMKVEKAATSDQKQRLIDADSATRKLYPMTTGLLDYFPDALAEVARVSYLGNAKHNPGEPMHHARGKSMDHADCIARHLTERGGYDTVTINGAVYRIRHSAALAWRGLALLQEELETDLGLPLPRAAR